jgi:hypothetical protein
VSDRKASADRLRERLAAHDGALRAYTGDVLYNVQVETTCRLLDAIDEIADEATAGLITDAIYERFTGDGVSEAAQRVREARAEMERLSGTAAPLWPPGARTFGEAVQQLGGTT